MRFSEFLKEDQTVPQLQQKIQQGFPDTKKRQHVTHEVTIKSLTCATLKLKKLLRISSTTTSNGNEYKQFMDIRNVEFQPSDSGNTVPIRGLYGNYHDITPSELNSTNVGVYCNCQDYQMRFAYYNVQNNCHVGAPPKPYTKTSDRPEVNPQHVPGMCKHLLKLTEELKKQKILQ